MKKDAFPPKIPSPEIDFGSGSRLLAVRSIRVCHFHQTLHVPYDLFQVRRALPEKLSPVGALPKLPTLSRSKIVKTPTDFSDLDVFVKDINTTVENFKPVLTLGTNLEDYIKRTKNQLVIPSQLHGNLTPFKTEIEFLHDASSFLQLFPVFKVILPPLTGALGNELQSIGSLDTDMTNLVTSTTSLSTSLQVTR